jgi:hypothetical protein
MGHPSTLAPQSETEASLISTKANIRKLVNGPAASRSTIILFTDVDHQHLI